MIIESDFIDHWKTEQLVGRCGPEGALCLIRLWSQCEIRKTDRLKAKTPEEIECIARWRGQSGALFDALKNLRFIGEKDGFYMRNFREYNKKLFTSRENGKKGGRPRARGGDNSKTQTNTEKTIQSQNKGEKNASGKFWKNSAKNRKILENLEVQNSQENSELQSSKNLTKTKAKPNHNLSETKPKPKLPDFEEDCQGAENEDNLLGINKLSDNLARAENGENAAEKTHKTQIEPNKKEEKEKREFPPPYPPFIEKKEKGERSKICAGAREEFPGERFVELFKERLQMSLIPKIEGETLKILVECYRQWARYRQAGKFKLTEFGVIIDAKNALKCLCAGLSASEIAEFFEQSIATGYRGWFFKEQLLKYRANQKNKIEKPAAVCGVPLGAQNWNPDA